MPFPEPVESPTSSPDSHAPESDAGRGAERPGDISTGTVAVGNLTPWADSRAARRGASVGLTAGRRHLGVTDSTSPRAAERAGDAGWNVH
jgi:hypothetical protein